VFRSNKPKIADFRAEYATPVDFCDLFRDATKHLYLLAFLLTANHGESEQCFVSTVEKAFKEQAVFKEWVRSRIKRTMIENASKIVSPALARNGQRRELWSAGQRDTQRECEIDSVTKLAAFERFVFVMSILERYSNWDCALLLGCNVNQVAEARLDALRRLPDLAVHVSPGNRQPTRRLGFTA
jgi:DNA-directed RNA polymerase specialized sigma24 family protein